MQTSSTVTRATGWLQQLYERVGWWRYTLLAVAVVAVGVAVLAEMFEPGSVTGVLESVTEWVAGL